MQVPLLQEVISMMSAEDEAEIRDAARWIKDMRIELDADKAYKPKVIELDKL